MHTRTQTHTHTTLTQQAFRHKFISLVWPVRVESGRVRLQVYILKLLGILTKLLTWVEPSWNIKFLTPQTDKYMLNLTELLTVNIRRSNMCGTGSTDESVSIVSLWQLLTPPVGVNRHCVKLMILFLNRHHVINWTLRIMQSRVQVAY